jgi:phosphoribosylformylglycinamidine synthase
VIDWRSSGFAIPALRDTPQTAREEFDAILDAADPGMEVKLTFDPGESVAAPAIATGRRPRVAILREQGVNGQNEMAAAFDRAGFQAIDLHMTDLLSGRSDLSSFSGLVACGGFSYGDVLGAGGGWARSILHHAATRDQFAGFFDRGDTFALGVCNGCQMLSHLTSLIPGSEGWPRFQRNLSDQFEARLVMVEVTDSRSIFFDGMAGSQLPVAVAHGEGRAEFAVGESGASDAAHAVALRYIDHYGRPTESYPFNPNGSPGGITGLTSSDGRVTIMMPHPERLFRTLQYSWHPDSWGDAGPWMRMFENARRQIG